MIEDALSKFEDKVRLLVAHVSLLKKENLSLRNQVMDKSSDGTIGNSDVVRSKLNAMIEMIDAELEIL
ncbi:MAG: hypothetical protein K9M49_04885 [Candidatus Marinimicrobia bacterium]|nr:hypothetical protein [Candidatus Neomarinimicrobiota bacterium]MCF7850669.1 hypothetical protein [Candidatus Neomarinimicrobiota bacterium]MCF7904472.1 hypothetical protein [Candidatus Neomarinimicrobiota bacterium]